MLVTHARHRFRPLCADPPLNMVIQGYSGSGKTVAMALLMLNRVNTQNNYPQIVCITPTNELTAKLYEKILPLALYMTDLRIRLIIRGEECE